MEEEDNDVVLLGLPTTPEVEFVCGDTRGIEAINKHGEVAAAAEEEDRAVFLVVLLLDRCG